VSNGDLGTWDAASAPDGSYILRLVVTDRLGRINVADTSATIATGSAVSGDMNGDGIIDIDDVMLALRIAAGLDRATPGMVAAGDVRPNPGGGAPVGDGRIAMDDVTAILLKVRNPNLTLP
jgi:hypothetical protein